LLASDPLVRKTLKTGYVTSIKLEELEEDDDSAMSTARTLAVIPLIDVYQKIWALVIVNEIPLFALQETTMDLFAILGGNIGDLIKRRAESYSYLDDGGKAFELKLRRVLTEIKLLKTSAMMIGVIINSKELQAAYLPRLQANLRGVDKIWVLKEEEQNRKIYLILLPYTNENGANEFLNRIGLSESLAENLYNRLNSKIFSYHNDDIRVCMWILDNKTLPKQTVTEINQFYKNGYFNIEEINDEQAIIANSL
jgi:polysaccharide biosynthesis protein PelD